MVHKIKKDEDKLSFRGMINFYKNLLNRNKNNEEEPKKKKGF